MRPALVVAGLPAPHALPAPGVRALPIARVSGCAAWVLVASAAPLLAGCGATPVRVDGVMRESSEMRPLQSVPRDAYAQVRVLVRAPTGDHQGAEQCGYAQLEGTLESDDRKNAACVPGDAPNDAVRIVRQRLRAYGVQVARDGSEPYDYAIDVRVTGQAPKQPDRMAAKAVVHLAFTLRPDDAASGFFGGLDVPAARGAFVQVARDCALRDTDLAAFSVSSTQPMNPEFDMMALASGAVDGAMGCDQMARFFRDAHTRFGKAAPPPPPAALPAPPAPISPVAPVAP